MSLELESAIGRFERAFANMATKQEKALQEWVALQCTYENDNQESLFQEWVLQEQRVSKGVTRIMCQLQHQDHYEHLKPDIRKLVDTLVRRLQLNGFWILYFALGRSLVQSRKALRCLVRVVKKRPQTDIHAILLELRRIRDQYRRYDRTRGVSKKMHSFALDDVLRMADALLPPTATACSRGALIIPPPRASAPEIEGVLGEHEEPINGPGLDSGEKHAQPYESNSKDAEEESLDWENYDDDGVGDGGDSGGESDFERSQPHEGNSNELLPTVLQKDRRVSRSSSPPTPEGGRRAPLAQDEYDLERDFLSSFHDSPAPPKAPQSYTKSQGKRLFEDIDLDPEESLRPLPSSVSIKRRKNSQQLVSDCSNGSARLGTEHECRLDWEQWAGPDETLLHWPQLGSSQDQSAIGEWGENEELSIDKMILRKRDIATLNDGTWLNDEVINFCVNCLIRTAKHRIQSFNSHFFASLTGAAGTSFRYEKVQRWTRKIDILDFDHLVIPIHQPPNHWSMAVISNLSSIRPVSAKDDMAEKSEDMKPLIITMDNRDGCGPMNRYIFSALSRYLVMEVRLKKGIQVETTDILWKHSHRVPAPEKQNNYDCGVFALVNLEQFLIDPKRFIASLDDSGDSIWNIDPQQERHRIRSRLFSLKASQGANLVSIKADQGRDELGTNSLVRSFDRDSPSPSSNTLYQLFEPSLTNMEWPIPLSAFSASTLAGVAKEQTSSKIVPGLLPIPSIFQHTVSSRNLDQPINLPNGNLESDTAHGASVTTKSSNPSSIRLTSISALQTLAKPNIDPVFEKWWGLELEGSTNDNPSVSVEQDLWNYVTTATSPIHISDFLATQKRALALGTITFDTSPSPLPFESIRKQYTKHFIHTSTSLANKLVRSKAKYDSSHQICVFLEALVKIFEDLSSRNTAKLKSLSAETQSQQDLFSNGLPGQQFDYYREKWLSDIENRIQRLTEVQSESEQVQKEIELIYPRVLLAQRNAVRVREALLIIIADVKGEIQGFVLKEERARKQQDEEIQNLMELLV